MIKQKKIIGTEEVSEMESESATGSIKEPEEKVSMVELKHPLEEALKRIHTEAEFAAKNLDGKSKEFEFTLNDQMSKFRDLIQEYKILIIGYEK